ncbi:uncharacterized protein LOC101848838 [Aplysia californica]|uniref:Uncharacterized protein LOC101848838 n=1 Tax=Aplysia californica TaxID=6500 RepID=A0ABM0K0A7_APLCA|nr:uncharacterized protein LOC101848838 [Aplysia californica]
MSLTGGIPDGAGQHDSEIGTTYFSYAGPSSLDAATSANITDNHTVSGDPLARKDVTQRSSDSLRSPSEMGDHDIMTIPARPRPPRDPQNILFLAPPYPGFCYPTYPPPVAPLAPQALTFDPVWRNPSDDTLPPKRLGSNPYPLKEMKMKHVLIFIAAMFVLAFVAVVFTAVYFGHKFT